MAWDTPQNLGFWNFSVCGRNVSRIIIAIPSNEIPFLLPKTISYSDDLWMTSRMTPIFGSLRVSSGFFGFLRVSSGFFGFLRVSSGFFGFLRVSSGFFGSLRFSPGLFGSLRASPGLVGSWSGSPRPLSRRSHL